MDTDTSPAAAHEPAGGIQDGDFSRLCGDGFDPAVAAAAAEPVASADEIAPDDADIYGRTYTSPPLRRLGTVQVTVNFRGPLRPAPYKLEPE